MKDLGISKNLITAVSSVMRTSDKQQQEQSAQQSPAYKQQYEKLGAARPLSMEDAKAATHEAHAPARRVAATIRKMYVTEEKKTNDPFEKETLKKRKERTAGEAVDEQSAPRTPAEKKLAAFAHPKNKITHKDVLAGRGVIAKEDVSVEEGLADEFAKMAREKGYNARVVTAAQKRKETEELMKKRAEIAQSTPARPAPPHHNPYPLGGYDPKSNRSYSEEVEQVEEGEGIVTPRKDIKATAAPGTHAAAVRAGEYEKYGYTKSGKRTAAAKRRDKEQSKPFPVREEIEQTRNEEMNNAYFSRKKEEAEQIDELTRKKLDAYMSAAAYDGGSAEDRDHPNAVHHAEIRKLITKAKKAGHTEVHAALQKASAAMDRVRASDKKIIDKRSAGFHLANDKLFGKAKVNATNKKPKMRKEEFEQIDEAITLSDAKTTAQRLVNKAIAIHGITNPRTARDHAKNAHAIEKTLDRASAADSPAHLANAHSDVKTYHAATRRFNMAQNMSGAERRGFKSLQAGVVRHLQNHLDQHKQAFQNAAAKFASKNRTNEEVELDEANTETKKEFQARQERLAAAHSETQKDPKRLARLMKIPGYADAMKLAQKTTQKEEVEQIDEVGDTPAGRAALTAVQARAHSTMDAWSKNPKSGYSSTPKAVKKATHAAVMAGNRLHGFGPDKLNANTVMARSALRQKLASQGIGEEVKQLDEAPSEERPRHGTFPYGRKARPPMDAIAARWGRKSGSATSARFTKASHGFGIAGPKKKLPEEFEQMEESLHPAAAQVLKHIKPEHHDIYKPHLQKGVFNGSYKDRADVLNAAERAGHAVKEEVVGEAMWPGTPAYERKFPTVKNSEFEKKSLGTGRTVYSRKPKPEEKKPVKEALNKDTPGNGYEHQCAVHVKHSKLGEGRTLFSQHAQPDEDGNIEWYTVMFEHGIEHIASSELEILVSENHMNHKKGKK